MASEAKRGVVRIISNYCRLFTTVILGLLVVRLHLYGVGKEALGLIGLIGSTIGLASMFRMIVGASLIRELGAVYHTNDDEAFRGAFSSACLISVAVATLSAVVYVGIWLALPYLNIEDHLLGAAQWLVFAKACETFVTVVLAPAFNMYKITERMVAHNLWTVMGRVSIFGTAAVLYLGLGIGPGDPARGLIWFGVISSSAFILVQICAAGVMMIGIDRRTVPSLGRITRSSVKSILRIGGWNSMAMIGIQLHAVLDSVIMNLAFGLFPGNLIWYLSTRLTSYVRMITTGMTEGVDAVSVRVSSCATTGEEAVRSLLHHSTRLHGFVAFPAMVVLFILAEPVLDLWVGGRIEHEDRTVAIPMIIALIRILSLGLVVRAIADNWMTILYGAGHVRRYALLILAGGFCNPILAGLLLLVLPEDIRFTAAACAYSAVIFVIHFLLLPAIGARAFEIPFAGMYSGLVRPLIATLFCTPILLIGVQVTPAWTAWWLLVWVGGFGAAYLILSVAFVLDGEERRRFAGAIRRRLGRGGKSRGSDPASSGD